MLDLTNLTLAFVINQSIPKLCIRHHILNHKPKLHRKQCLQESSNSFRSQKLRVYPLANLKVLSISKMSWYEHRILSTPLFRESEILLSVQAKKIQAPDGRVQALFEGEQGQYTVMGGPKGPVATTVKTMDSCEG